MALSLLEFIARWQASTLTEKSAAQSHFIQLCDVLGVPSPTEVDVTGATYTFEKGAAKTGGGEGWADVWKRGYFGWEYKGKRKNLDAAYQQLLLYREDLENPPLLVVCDLDRFQVHTNFTSTVKRVFEFTLEDLKANKATAACPMPPLDVLRAVFTEPERLRPQQTTENVTERAAAEFARLSESLSKRGADPERAAHFLMRQLFCLFAEDIGLLPSRLFTRLVEGTRTKPEAFEARVRLLFGAMATGGSFGVEDIAYFNGGLFADEETLPLEAGDLEVLLRAATLDWASVEPAIFGTLFERSLDPSKRSQLGAHYTSKEDILLIVEPVLMEPLRRRWAAVQEEAQGIIAKREAAKDASVRTKMQGELGKVLMGFTDEIAAVRVLDPACGSGNFLYVALKRLLDLEKEVSVFGAMNGLSGMLPKVDPSQVYGIETNAYAYELASVVVWIGYIQWLRDNGFGAPSSPILKRLDNVRHMDAILAYDEAGKPVEPEWPEADVIIGNPPFLGSRKMRPVHGDKYCDALQEIYSGRIDGLPDLVCYWFERARKILETKRNLRTGLIATNSIRGGANRRVLERIKQTGDIFMAWSDHPWVLESANVRVSVVGFDDGRERARTLDGRSVVAVNPDLTAASDLSLAIQLRENSNIGFQGVVLRGPFDLTTIEAQRMFAITGNPNSRPNTDVIKPRMNGMDITRRNSNSYVVDFGIGTSIESAAQYEAPFEHIRKFVYPMRQQANQVLARERWWLHWNPRPAMWQALSGLSRYIGTPTVSKYRLFTWIKLPTLPDHQLIAFARDDDYFFGVLHSKPHELWALRMGTSLEDRPRYTPTTTFETFPFPWPPGKEPEGDARVEAIAEAARDLVAKRDAWLNPEGASEAELRKRTLTNLYNQRPTWLDMAHRRLDEAVLDAYGWPRDLGDEEILERLLGLNLERGSGA
jgi:type II restriction/modification system DNA methylase subunit YeeA